MSGGSSHQHESFLYMLQVTRRLQCSHQRERIYALLGFVCAGLFPVVFSAPHERVCISLKPLVQLRFAGYPSNSIQETAVPRLCLSSRVHALHMRRQLVFSVESFATSARAAMAGRVVTPEAGLVGGMERGVVSPQLPWATEGLACAALIVARILSVAEYRADTRDSIVVVVGRVDGSPRPSTLLFRVDHVASRRLSKEVQI
jgi:hypothetical protein